MRAGAALVMLVALASWTRPAGAQPTVRVEGRVFDDEIREQAGMAAVRGVEGVRVQLVATSDTSRRTATLSDRQGRFVFHGLAPGRYAVRLARLGYSALRWEREFTRDHDTLSVGMRPSNGGDYVCPGYAVLEPRFRVIVRDEDARPVTSGVTVVARSVARVDTLRLTGSAFGAIPVQEGRYVLEVTGSGFRPLRTPPFEVRWTPENDGRALCGIQTPRTLFVERTD